MYIEVNALLFSQDSSLVNFHHHSDQMTCFYKRTVFESPVKVSMSVKETHPAVALTFGGEIFYLRVTRLKARAVWVVYLAGQMSVEDCKGYRATLELSSPHQGGISRLPGQPSRLIQSLEEVMKSGNYILVSEPDIKNISSPSGFFNLSCEITRNT